MSAGVVGTAACAFGSVEKEAAGPATAGSADALDIEACTAILSTIAFEGDTCRKNRLDGDLAGQ
jgi:hypothetical protein